MRQAKAVQEKMQKLQEELNIKEYEGSAGSGVVKAVVSGAGLVKKLWLDPSIINKDEKEILEDLIIAALNDARKKADDESGAAINQQTSGLKLPAGLKF